MQAQVYQAEGYDVDEQGKLIESMVLLRDYRTQQRGCTLLLECAWFGELDLFTYRRAPAFAACQACCPVPVPSAAPCELLKISVFKSNLHKACGVVGHAAVSAVVACLVEHICGATNACPYVTYFAEIAARAETSPASRT